MRVSRWPSELGPAFLRLILGAWTVRVLPRLTGGRAASGPQTHGLLAAWRAGKGQAGRKSRSAEADAGLEVFLGLGGAASAEARKAGAAAEPPAECPAPGGSGAASADGLPAFPRFCRRECGLGSAVTAPSAGAREGKPRISGLVPTLLLTTA